MYLRLRCVAHTREVERACARPCEVERTRAGRVPPAVVPDSGTGLRVRIRPGGARDARARPGVVNARPNDVCTSPAEILGWSWGRGARAGAVAGRCGRAAVPGDAGHALWR